MRKIGILAAGIILLLATRADATLLALDDAKFGIDSFTYDTVTGLKWLDLTQTLNKSINDIKGEMGVGGEYNGLRYATSAEVSKLYADAGLNQVTVSNSPQLPYYSYLNVASTHTGSYLAAYDLMHLIGYLPPPYSSLTVYEGELPTLLIWGVTGDGPVDPFDHYMISELIAKDPGTGPYGYGHISYQADDVTAKSFTSSDIVGSFLVKDDSAPSPEPVPEPGTLLLVGMGLAGMRWLRKVRSA